MSKVDVQFKISHCLLNKINSRLTSGITKGPWIEEALHDLALDNNPKPLPLTATDLFADRVTLLVRIDYKLLSRIDKICKGPKYTRTIFILDAIISKLAESRSKRCQSR